MGNCFEGVSGAVPRTPPVGFKVCVCGGAGGIGQPLCMLMALDPRVWDLAVYDLTIAMVPAEGISADLSHIERKCKVKAYSLETTQKPVEHLKECLEGCSLVLVSAGVPSKDRAKSDLLKINANIAKSIVEACAKYCPNAVVGLMVNPLNSILPAMARLYEKAGCDPLKIVGITTLDVVRANKFVHEETGLPIEYANVPVIGGFSASMSGPSILPVLSQDRVGRRVPPERHAHLISRLQDAGKEIVDAKKGKGNATLSMAYAAARFGQAVLAGLAGFRTVETALVKSSVCPGLDFFSSRVTFGPKGVERVLPIGKLTPAEEERLKEVVQTLKADIQDGLNYAEHAELALG